MSQAYTLDLSFFESAQNYDLLVKAQQDLTFRPTSIIYNIIELIQGAVIVVSFIAILAFQPLILAVIVLSILPMVLFANRYGSNTFMYYDFSTRDGRQGFYYERLLTSVENAMDIRLLNIGKILIDRRNKHSKEVMDKRILATANKANKIFLGDLYSTLGQVAVFTISVNYLYANRISLGEFSLILGTISLLRSQLMSIMVNYGNYIENSLFFSNVGRFLSLKPNINLSEKGEDVPITIQNGISLVGVYFKYPDSDSYVFEDLNIVFEPNQSVALVGENGAGKTTLIKLLTRMYDPTLGHIVLDGVDIKSYNLGAYRKLYSVLLQEYSRYQFSVKENIGLVDIGKMVDEEMLNLSMYNANATEFVGRLPKKLETVLGRQFDDEGFELSGGQWQRIALARVFYQNSPILILDEPSSSLDVVSEESMFNKYKEITRNKISILITHRFNTVKMSDRIIVLEGGKIVEDGTHESLLGMKGKYFAMFSAQAESFKA
ncbi:ABC transporter ATP-binding protein [Deinococcus ruber]|uniref:ABC transporter ATP-binding protein n=1 Tax=Deinococcus ruber TaxID=1848197 RepID=UPI00166760BD|nr:ABC transporter ATP-binding protein [Deinococcus ruber]